FHPAMSGENSGDPGTSDSGLDHDVPATRSTMSAVEGSQEIAEDRSLDLGVAEGRPGLRVEHAIDDLSFDVRREGLEVGERGGPAGRDLRRGRHAAMITPGR